MISEQIIERVLQAALDCGGEFSEVFIEDKKNTNITSVGGRIEDSISGRDYGLGLRIIDKDQSIYTYTNDLREENLIQLAKEAASILKSREAKLEKKLQRENLKNINPIKIYPSTVLLKDKLDLMKSAYEAAKSVDDRINQVRILYLDEEQKVTIANSKGLFKTDERVRSRFVVASVASDQGDRQTGYYGPGRSQGFEMFDEIDVQEVAKRASQIAVNMIGADFAPTGEMPVILNNEFGGVLFHEACGHSLEAGFISRKTSEFTGKLNEKIASSVVTAIDDGTIPNAWGTSTIDDEGTPTQKNILIEDGILKSYLVDNFNGKKLGLDSTGSGRRQSYKFAPTSRMNNTYIAPGKSSFEDLISNTEYGIYAKELGGGQVDITTGDFNFAVSEAYLVENGKIVKPVKGATLIGKGARVLERIDMVSDGLSLGEGICGASSGQIPVCLGQPPLRVSKLTVGGRD